MCENHFGKVLLLNTISTNQFLQAFVCFVLFLFALIKEENYNISNIIIMSIIITVQKYAQTPQLNEYTEHCTSHKTT